MIETNLINEFSKIGHKKNQYTKISIFLCTNNKPTEEEIRKIISFKITLKST